MRNTKEQLREITSPCLSCFCEAFCASVSRTVGGEGEGTGAGGEPELCRFTICLIRVLGEVLRDWFPSCVSRGPPCCSFGGFSAGCKAQRHFILLLKIFDVCFNSKPSWQPCKTDRFLPSLRRSTLQSMRKTSSHPS